MTTEKHTPVLPALTDKVSGAQYGSRYKGRMPALGDVVHVLTNPQLEGLPGPVAVHLFRPDRVVASSDENADVHAVVTYSNGATQNVFRCDWDAQFSVVCSRISIALETYKPFSSAYEPGTRDHIFGALIGLGACPSGGSDAVGYTTAVEAVVTGLDGATEAIPDFARRYYPLVLVNGNGGNPAQLAQIVIQMHNAQGWMICSVPYSEAVAVHGLPIPGAAVRVAVLCHELDYVTVMHHFRLGL